MKIMAVDLGVARTGLAVCDRREILASPVGTVQEHNPERLAARVAAAAQEQGAEQLVVGHPLNMAGTCGESARRAEAFAQRLRELPGLPVSLWDGRMATVTAIGYLNETDARGKKRKQVVDSVAATVILQNYLEARRLQG